MKKRAPKIKNGLTEGNLLTINCTEIWVDRYPKGNLYKDALSWF